MSATATEDPFRGGVWGVWGSSPSASRPAEEVVAKISQEQTCCDSCNKDKTVLITWPAFSSCPLDHFGHSKPLSQIRNCSNTREAAVNMRSGIPERELQEYIQLHGNNRKGSRRWICWQTMEKTSAGVIIINENELQRWLLLNEQQDLFKPST